MQWYTVAGSKVFRLVEKSFKVPCFEIPLLIFLRRPYLIQKARMTHSQNQNALENFKESFTLFWLCYILRTTISGWLVLYQCNEAGDGKYFLLNFRRFWQKFWWIVKNGKNLGEENVTKFDDGNWGKILAQKSLQKFC